LFGGGKAMKKIFACTLVFLTVSVSAHAMTISQQWDKTFNLGSIEMFLSTQQTSDGGYIVSGRTDAGLSVNGYIAKIDNNGNIIWQKMFDSGGLDIVHSIQQTTDGGYVAAGTTSCGLFVFKLDGAGAAVWQKCYGFGDSATVRQTSDGGYIVQAFSDNMRVLKLDSLGNVFWQKKYSNTMGINITEYKYTIQETADEGYIMVSAGIPYNAYTIKTDSSGNILWQRAYDMVGGAFYINTTADGGYITAGAIQGFGAGDWDFYVTKLNSNGDVVWQKAYGENRSDYATSIQQTNDGGYIVAGGFRPLADNNLLVLKLHPNGEISWAKTYKEEFSGFFPSIHQTIDGGYIVGSDYRDESNSWDFWLLKLDNNGEIGNCQVMETPELTTTDLSIPAQDGIATAMTNNEPVIDITIPFQDTLAGSSVLCYYEDPHDIDGDGINNTPGGTMTSSMFLTNEDNCPDMPNGPFLGTCIVGETYKIARPCINDVECGTDGFCSMNQEDSNEDGIGDACCLCECDFDCSGGVDASDVTAFLNDFGRSQHNDPCTNQDHCSGDVDCNGAVDANDVINFLQDFGRSQFNNPCPACEVGNWCVYP
jgi:hypothetical protein